jgi:hypothetical protein
MYSQILDAILYFGRIHHRMHVEQLSWSARHKLLVLMSQAVGAIFENVQHYQPVGMRELRPLESTPDAVATPFSRETDEHVARRSSPQTTFQI